LGAVVVGVFVIAFVVRLSWLVHVQSPLDSVYSDMAGYVDRAEQLLQHRMPAEPKVLALFPPGTHFIVALEFLAFGRNGRMGIAIAHALVGSVPAACAVALTVQLVPSLIAGALAGLLVAFWYPQVAFTGFFSSELWFAAAIAVQAWLGGRRWRRPAGEGLVGITSAAAIVIRSQFMLTWAIETAAVGLSRLRTRGLRRALLDVAFLAVPVAVTLTMTSLRFHRLTGRWGLVNESAGNRLWADTDVCKIEASWRTPNGEEWSYWFSPPSKPSVKPSDTVTFRGYVVDPEILGRITAERTRGVPLRDRLRRRVHNVSLLLFENLPWPESNYHEPVRFVGFGSVDRHAIGEWFRAVLLFPVLPLGALGLALGRRNRTMFVLAANLFTLVFAAAFFFGEARYHVPYDPFFLVLAVVGAYELLRRAARHVARRRLRAVAPEPAPAPVTSAG